ncbi:zinc-dependent metalloprotease [bacterium]|nr:zinc-dependent metalloprotease [bacterium]
MTKFLSTTILSIFLTFSFQSFAQNKVCGSYKGYIQDDMHQNPEFYQSISEKNQSLKQEFERIQNNLDISSLRSTSDNKKIIPVVVHIIHDDGPENVSDEVVQQAIDALNRNINGQSNLFESRTPDVFAALRGVPNVEFRLARIDPNGESTNGIVRVKSPLTNEPSPRNAVKSVSYWNSYQYFNIWVIKKFLPESNGNTLLGFAQFPFSGSMTTDGVVLIYSEFNDPSSSTLTHEAGHWLGLCHPWDCGAGTCGDDNIFDTPPAREANYGVSFNNFPYHVGLQNQGCIADSMNWAGEMFMNYMDYTPDQFTTMFSKGQVEVINETLEGDGTVPGFRQYMWSEVNIDETGTSDGFLPPTCTKQLNIFENNDAYQVCIGEETWFRSNSRIFGNSISSVEWDFGDGTITNGSYNGQLGHYELHTYANEGTYDVKFKITYDEVIKVRASDPSLIPATDPSLIQAITTDKIVQGTQDELNNMSASNISSHYIDSLGKYWGLEDTTFYRGKVQETIYEYDYTNTCVTEIVKAGFITVSPSVSSNSSPEEYSFETGLGNDWSVSDNSAEESIWTNVNGSYSGFEWSNGSLVVNNFERVKVGVIGGYTEIVSKSFNLSNFSTPAIKFSWAGAALNTFPTNEITVHYSTNCGENWLSLGTLDPVTTSRAGYIATNFVPNENDWLDTVLTKNALKNNNIKFKIAYSAGTTAHNNIYIDNIKIGEASSLFNENNNSISQKISVFPNPLDESSSILLENFGGQETSIDIINILGEKVYNIFEGVIQSDYLEINNLRARIKKDGIYFVRATSSSNKSFTKKIILN